MKSFSYLKTTTEPITDSGDPVGGTEKNSRWHLGKQPGMTSQLKILDRSADRDLACTIAKKGLLAFHNTTL